MPTTPKRTSRRARAESRPCCQAQRAVIQAVAREALPALAPRGGEAVVRVAEEGDIARPESEASQRTAGLGLARRGEPHGALAAAVCGPVRRDDDPSASTASQRPGQQAARTEHLVVGMRSEHEHAVAEPGWATERSARRAVALATDQRQGERQAEHTAGWACRGAAAQGHPLELRPLPGHSRPAPAPGPAFRRSCSRSSTRRIFPLTVFGRLATNSIARGYL